MHAVQTGGDAVVHAAQFVGQAAPTIINEFLVAIWFDIFSDELVKLILDSLQTVQSAIHRGQI